MFGHHAAWNTQAEHAQRIANTIEHFTLRSQIARIGAVCAQENIERFLDPQQVVLDRGRHGVEQRAVVSRDRTFRMLDFALCRQRIEPVQLGDFVARPPRSCASGWLGSWSVRAVIGRKFGLATIDQTLDLAIDLPNSSFTAALA